MREKAAKRELFLFLVSLALLIHELNVYTVLIFALSGILLSLEAINTAIELLCNLHTLEFDERIRAIKDVAATAIFIIPCIQLALLAIWYADSSGIGIL